MQSDFVIDATGLNPVRGDYRIVDVRKIPLSRRCLIAYQNAQRHL